MKRRAPTETEIRRVRLLLDTSDDYLPGPSAIQMGDMSGPAPSSRRPCDDCRKTGKTTAGICLVCNGTGLRRATMREQRTDGWDEYVEAPVSEAVVPQLSAGIDRASEIRRLDASIARIQRTLDAKDGKQVDEAYGWERLRSAYEREGSYGELRRCLGELRKLWPAGYSTVRRIYTIRLVELSPHDRAVEELAVTWLAREMRHIRVPHWVEQEASTRRNDTIETLAAQGMGAGAIARRLKLSKEKVRSVLRKRDQRRPDGECPSDAPASLKV